MPTTILDAEAHDTLVRLVGDKIEEYDELQQQFKRKYGCLESGYTYMLDKYRHALAQLEAMETNGG